MANEITQRYLLLIKTLVSDGRIGSGKDFALQIGVSPSSITEIDKGRTNVGLTAIQKAVTRFPDISLDWLMGGVGGIFKTKSTESVNNANVNSDVNPNVNFPKLHKRLTNEEGILETKTPKNVVNGKDDINDDNNEDKRKLQKTSSNDGEIFKTKSTRNLINENDKGNDKDFDKEPKLQKTLSNDGAILETKTPLLKASGLVIDNSTGMSRVTLSKSDDAVEIPVTDIEAAAGGGAANADFIDNATTLRLPASMLSGRAGKRLCVNVTGESMEPTLYDHSQVVIRLLGRNDWGVIKSGAVCVVTTRDGSTYVKRVKNKLKTEGVLTLTSDNENKRRYKPFDVSEDEIHNIWAVELYITDNIPEDVDELDTVRDEMADIRRSVLEITELVKGGKKGL